MFQRTHTWIQKGSALALGVFMLLGMSREGRGADGGVATQQQPPVGPTTAGTGGAAVSPGVMAGLKGLVARTEKRAYGTADKRVVTTYNMVDNLRGKPLTAEQQKAERVIQEFISAIKEFMPPLEQQVTRARREAKKIYNAQQKLKKHIGEFPGAGVRGLRRKAGPSYLQNRARAERFVELESQNMYTAIDHADKELESCIQEMNRADFKSAMHAFQKNGTYIRAPIILKLRRALGRFKTVGRTLVNAMNISSYGSTKTKTKRKEEEFERHLREIEAFHAKLPLTRTKRLQRAFGRRKESAVAASEWRKYGTSKEAPGSLGSLPSVNKEGPIALPYTSEWEAANKRRGGNKSAESPF